MTTDKPAAAPETSETATSEAVAVASPPPDESIDGLEAVAKANAAAAQGPLEGPEGGAVYGAMLAEYSEHHEGPMPSARELKSLAEVDARFPGAILDEFIANGKANRELARRSMTVAEKRERTNRFVDVVATITTPMFCFALLAAFVALVSIDVPWGYPTSLFAGGAAVMVRYMKARPENVRGPRRDDQS